MTDEAFDVLARQAATFGLRLTPAQIAACALYAHALAEATKTVNLTAITEIPDIAIRHFLDSFTAYAARPWTGHERVVDVGSGAGFPGLALRIALPGIAVTCVEATGKKARFIDRMRDELALDHVEVINDRGEEVARDPGHRARYDVATARALGSLALCVELLLPLLRVGGEAIVWKGRFEAELPPARKALTALGGELGQVIATSDVGLSDVLPGRSLVVLRKTRPTPDRYPRTPADMKRRPW
ncbi:MAG: 16S rRNA (guanine(527)-N(7))-methyltransferase RsmG [Chloroflexi bacterium]|nr:16S rRNA (guanine(527)-N(7))-methyltransferase RsmG [Chloroflexota bacterium]